MVEDNKPKKKKQETNGILLIGLAIIALVLIVTGSNSGIEVSIIDPDSFEDVFLNTVDFFYNIAKGNVENTTSVFKFGTNPSLGTAEEVIWDGGGNYIFLNAAERLNISSASVLDTNGSSGAWNLLVFGLDNNFDQIQELVYLNGTTAVQTTQEFRRTYRAIVLNSGSPTAIGDSNLGDVEIVSADTATLQAKILQNNGQTLMAVYTIPRGHTGYATGLSFNAGQGKEVRFKAKFRNGNTITSAFSVKYGLTIFESTVLPTLKTPLRVPEMTDIVITGTLTSAPNVVVDASFGLILEDNR